MGDAAALPRLVEAILFIGSRPLTLVELRRAAPAALHADLAAAVEELNSRYERQGRPYRIEKSDDGWRMRLEPAMADWVREKLRPDRGVKLSRAALDVLSITAYRQPISRPAIETLLRTDAGPALRQLLRRRLVALAEAGPGEAAASLYVTTPRFLQLFGLKSLAELPTLEELQL